MLAAEDLITNISSPEVKKEEKKASKLADFLCCRSSPKSKVEANSKPNEISQGAILKAPDIEKTAELSYFLLPPLADTSKKTLILDLDETLLHSTFDPVESDHQVPIKIGEVVHTVHVSLRPHVHEFLLHVSQMYEIVIFTASLSNYADPVIDLLDIHKVVKYRLFRDSCFHYQGNYIKDLNVLGRPLKDTIIIDNMPNSYYFHVNNAIPISSWFFDKSDSELMALIPFLEELYNEHDVTKRISAEQK